MSFLFNNAPLVHSRNLGDTTWDNSTGNSKFTLTRGCPSKLIGNGVSNEQMHMHMPGIKPPHLIDMQSSAAKGFLASKNSVADVSNPGMFSTCGLLIS